MREAASIEIHTRYVIACMVDIGKRLKRIRNERRDTPVLIKGKAIEQLVSLRRVFDSLDQLQIRWRDWPNGLGTGLWLQSREFGFSHLAPNGRFV